MRAGWKLHNTTCNAQARLCYIMSENSRPTITLIWPAISTVCSHDVSVWIMGGWVAHTMCLVGEKWIFTQKSTPTEFFLHWRKGSDALPLNRDCPLKLHTHYINIQIPQLHHYQWISEALNEVRIPCIFVVPTYTSFHGLIVATLVDWQFQYISLST